MEAKPDLGRITIPASVQEELWDADKEVWLNGPERAVQMLSIEGFCRRHARFLAYPEFRTGACFWCHPEKTRRSDPIRQMNPRELRKLLVNQGAPPLP
jgi:hypothetical protein